MRGGVPTLTAREFASWHLHRPHIYTHTLFLLSTIRYMYTVHHAIKMLNHGLVNLNLGAHQSAVVSCPGVISPGRQAERVRVRSVCWIRVNYPRLTCIHFQVPQSFADRLDCRNLRCHPTLPAQGCSSPSPTAMQVSPFRVLDTCVHAALASYFPELREPNV